MKKIMLAFMAAGAVLSISACGLKEEKPADVHNSQNSLDWSGAYTGTVPAADAEGIKVQIVLNTDETYTLTCEYLGKDGQPYTDTGKFTWDKDGGVIKLDCKDAPPYYKVCENYLLQLDAEGKVIAGDLAGHYILKKTAQQPAD